MPDQAIDLIIAYPRADDEDWAFWSPQVPGLVGGRDSLLQLQQDLPEILRFAGVSFPVRVRAHVENTYDAGGEQIVVRAAQDEHIVDRVEAGNRLRAALTDDRQRADILDAPRTRTGEALFILAVPSDRVGDVGAQLHPAGEATVVVLAVADELVWMMNITNRAELNGTARPLDERGWPEDMTFGEIMKLDSAPSAVLVDS